MSGPTRSASWDELVSALAQIAESPVDSIERSTRLIDDLGLDSVALTELVVCLVDDFGIDSISRSLDKVPWDRLTVGTLFDRFVLPSGDAGPAELRGEPHPPPQAG